MFDTLRSALMSITLSYFELFIPHSAESMKRREKKTRARQWWKNWGD